jgi:hypothetical protein
MRLLEAGGEPFKLLASRVTVPPPSVEDYVVRVDPTGRDKALNRQGLTAISKGFGRDYSRLFVFPAGLASRLDPSKMRVTDSAWSDAFCRIALRANANLVPMWFGGHNSAAYYVLCLLLGRLGTVALPAEFFKPKRQPLVGRIGIPIPARSTAYFGDLRLSALRAATYSRATGGGPPDLGLWSQSEPEDRQKAATLEVSVLAADAVDRDSILALRRECLGEDDWSETDLRAKHILVTGPSRCVGYCRILPWDDLNPPLLRRTSAVHSVYVPDARFLRDHRVVEFDRLCLLPGYDRLALAESLGRGLRSAAFASNVPTLALGVVRLAGHNPVLASAQFEFARRTARCPHWERFAAREELVGASPHHDFQPERIRYDQPPQVAGLPSIIQTCLALGARFGPSASWRQFGGSASVLVSISSGELLRHTQGSGQA